MSGAILVNRGLLASLDDRLAVRLFARLWRNGHEPAPADTLDAYTTAVFPSYADIELTGAWPAAQLDAAGRAFSTQVVTWTRGAGGVAEWSYGWLVYERAAPDSFLVAAKRLTLPVRTIALGDQVAVAITLFALRG